MGRINEHFEFRIMRACVLQRMQWQVKSRFFPIRLLTALWNLWAELGLKMIKFR